MIRVQSDNHAGYLDVYTAEGLIDSEGNRADGPLQSHRILAADEPELFAALVDAVTRSCSRAVCDRAAAKQAAIDRQAAELEERLAAEAAAKEAQEVAEGEP